MMRVNVKELNHERRWKLKCNLIATLIVCGEQTNVGVENKLIFEIVKLANLDTPVCVKSY
jgi:hypothetical protein